MNKIPQLGAQDTERLLSALSFGPGLDVLFASRLDQIHLKLYAVADQGTGRHLQDLQALAPTEGELIAAAGWCRRHDPSEGFAEVLSRVLADFGVGDAR
jgi:hypothetical protein